MTVRIPPSLTRSYSFMFTTAGEYAYFCGLHPHMKGKMVVAP